MILACVGLVPWRCWHYFTMFKVCWPFISVILASFGVISLCFGLWALSILTSSMCSLNHLHDFGIILDHISVQKSYLLVCMCDLFHALRVCPIMPTYEPWCIHLFGDTLAAILMGFGCHFCMLSFWFWLVQFMPWVVMLVGVKCPLFVP